MDYTHVMERTAIVSTGDGSLVDEINENGGFEGSLKQVRGDMADLKKKPRWRH